MYSPRRTLNEVGYEVGFWMKLDTDKLAIMGYKKFYDPFSFHDNFEIIPYPIRGLTMHGECGQSVPTNPILNFVFFRRTR